MLSATKDPTPIYKVKVKDKLGIILNAYLEPANEEDMLYLSTPDFTFAWNEFWQNSSFDCEAIIKLSYKGVVLGLIRFGLYPFPSYTPDYLEVLHLQCVPKARRLVNPVGFWLLWYAAQIAFNYCVSETDGTLLRLDSLENAIPYYRDKVKMEELGWTDIAPGKTGYAFRFTKETAKGFCTRVEQEYGCPAKLG